jgi:hypothetical protein
LFLFDLKTWPPPIFVVVWRRELKDQPNVIWMDNFSKLYATGIQKVESGAYRDCLWSGMGIRKYQGSPVDIQVRDGVDAMPDELFSEEAVDSLTEMLKVCDKEFWGRYEVSLVKKYEVRNVPLKPDIDKVEPRYREVLQESRDGMKSFYPMKIIPLNIGSNPGLVQVAMSTWDDHRYCHRMFNYQYITADSNIFWRLCRVSNMMF